MKKIAIVCAFFIVIMAAILGLLAIFEVISFETAMSNMLKFGGAIAILGAASALISLMMNSKNNSQ